MRVSIMQPYLFPYIGYFQLIFCADVFVILDDVQYIKRGWINRNRILLNGREFLVTLPVVRAPQNHRINERRYDLSKRNIDRLLNRIAAGYQKAPHFSSIFPVLTEILTYSESNVALFNEHSIHQITKLLNISAQIRRSSEFLIKTDVAGSSRVLNLCQLLGADEYVNPIGGQALYSSEEFAEAGIDLKFLETEMPRYRQFSPMFASNLSIIDVLMFNSLEHIHKNQLSCFRLAKPLH
jgi:hypothetical protein